MGVIDEFVNLHDESATNLNNLLDAVLPPLIISLIAAMKNDQIRCRYLMILSKFGWNDQDQIFTKSLNVNDLMKLSDEFCAIHLNERDMMESSSKLLWSNKAEKTMVVTFKGRDVLKRHRMQNRTNSNALPPAPPN